MRRVIRLIIIVIALAIPQRVFSQYAYLGTASRSDGLIYEDCLLDDGTRYIMSTMWELGKFGFGLCMFVPEDGEPWYGLAIESKEYIPKNGFVVIIPNNGSNEPYVLGQRMSDKSQVYSKRSTVNPIFIFGGGRSNIAFSTYQTTDIKDVSFAIYDIPEDVLNSIISTGINDIRISSRSTYYKLKSWTLERMASYLGEAKEYLDIRASKSVNCILDDIEE